MVSLPLEANVAVGKVVVAVLRQAHQILREIPNVKRQKPHFDLLPQMNLLVVNYTRCWPPRFYQYKRKQRHTVGTHEGNTD